MLPHLKLLGIIAGILGALLIATNIPLSGLGLRPVSGLFRQLDHCRRGHA